jgi:hypothetical protein
MKVFGPFFAPWVFAVTMLISTGLQLKQARKESAHWREQYEQLAKAAKQEGRR